MVTLFETGDKVVVVSNNYHDHYFKIDTVCEVISITARGFIRCKALFGKIARNGRKIQCLDRRDLELYDDSHKYFFIEHGG